MILKTKRVIVAALAAMAITLTGSFFAAGSASAAQHPTVTVARPFAKTSMYATPDPIVIIDR